MTGRKDILHILITRFNLRMEGGIWDRDQAGRLVLTEEWMAERWSLFTAYCLPSVLGQSCRDFEWLLYFDDGTSDIYRERLEAICEEHGNIQTFFVPSYRAFGRHLDSWLAEHPDKPDHLISSRLDNDDILHPEAMGRIQEEFNGQDYQPVNLARGCTFAPGPPAELSVYNYPRGPFVSLIERWGTDTTPETVVHREHTEFLDLGPVVQIVDRPYWAQLIHQANLSNRMRGRPVRNLELMRDFGIEPGEGVSVARHLADLAAYYLAALRQGAAGRFRS
jgi:hypothetical protein